MGPRAQSSGYFKQKGGKGDPGRSGLQSIYLSLG